MCSKAYFNSKGGVVVFIRWVTAARGDGVDATRIAWVAAEDAFDGEPATAEDAVLLQSLQGVAGAGGVETAAGTE